MNRIAIMAALTFREAARKKILWMALLAAVGFMALFATALHFQLEGFHLRRLRPVMQREILSGMLMMGMYAIDLLIVLITVLVSVDTLSGEIASGTIQAIITKPMRRSELLLGKWLGFTAMLTLYIAAMVFGLNELTRLMSGVSARHLLRGLSLICMESILLLSLTFFFGTCFSTLTNGVLALGLHGVAFLGGWVEQVGALTQTQKALDAGIIASLIMPSEALWRRAAFEMQSPLTTAVNFSPFSGASIPSRAMILYAAVYTLFFLALAIRRLQTRDL